MADTIESILATWKPECWDAVTLEYLKSPEGAQALAILNAAPDLFAALQWALQYQPSCHFAKGIDGKEYHTNGSELLHERKDCWVCAARAAIAKATGAARSPDSAKGKVGK